MSLHSDTLFWFRANQSLLFLLNAAYLSDKQEMPILVFGLTRPGLEPTTYRTRGEHAFCHRCGVFRINVHLLEIIMLFEFACV